jgi:hypothetical protein
MEKDYVSLERAEAVLARWRSDDAVVWDARDSDFKTYMDAIASLQSLHDRTAGEAAPPATKALHESARRLLLNETPKFEEGLLHILQPYSAAASPEKVQLASWNTRHSPHRQWLPRGLTAGVQLYIAAHFRVSSHLNQ